MSLSAALGVLALLASSAPASWVNLGGSGGANVSMLEQTPNRIALELTVGGFERTDVSVNGRTYVLPSLPSEAHLLQAGDPDLPSVARSVIIPDDRLMNLNVIGSQFVDLSGLDVAPSKGNLLRTVDPSTVPYSFGPVYETAGFYPATQATEGQAYILRDYRGLTVTFSPFAYNPATHTLRVYTKVDVEIVDGGPGGENILVRRAPLASVSSAFMDIYRQHFLNFPPQPQYKPVPAVGSMLVICYDDFAAVLQPFVDWKNQEGIPTTMVLKSQVGSTSDQIKAYIQNVYNNSDNPKLTFVLLVGDAAQMPTPYSDGGPADPTYAQVAGNDQYPDIFVGRFSAESVAQAQTQAVRSVNYEESPLIGGAGDWYPHGTGIGSQYGPGDNNEYDYQHIDKIRTTLLNFTYTLVDQLYGINNPQPTQADVAKAVNAGRTIINYCGHGSQTSWGTTNFSNTDVNNLDNENKLPFIFSVACVNGEFDNGTCFAEAWLRATKNGNPTGAVATYMSSIDQSWDPPMAAQDGADTVLVTNAVRTFGAFCYDGSCAMMDKYGADGASMFRTWHIFGDPSLRVRTATPAVMSASCADTIAASATDFPVYVPGVAGALCALSYEGQYLGSAFTDNTGHADILVAGSLPSGALIQLTVSSFNMLPVFMNIQVGSPLIPSIVFDPTSFDVTVPYTGMVNDTLQVSNQGQAGSLLNFTVHFTSQYPGRWVTLTPGAGSIPNGQSMNLLIQFNSIGFPAGSSPTGQLVFDFNPSQEATVPITMHVGDVTGIGVQALPLTLDLKPAGPNPFQGGTLLSWALPKSGSIRLAVYDAAGRMVRLLDHGPAEAGYHLSVWDGMDHAGRSVATGVYFIKLEAGRDFRMTRLLRTR